MPIEDNQVMTDADRYLFRRLHDHARTLERSLAEHPEHRDRTGIRGRHSRPGRRRIADDQTLAPPLDYACGVH